MQDFMSKKKPVQLEDCKIKHARRGPKMETMLKGHTTISASPKTFDVAVKILSLVPTKLIKPPRVLHFCAFMMLVVLHL